LRLISEHDRPAAIPVFDGDEDTKTRLGDRNGEPGQLVARQLVSDVRVFATPEPVQG
jgi:hypothetical protein